MNPRLTLALLVLFVAVGVAYIVIGPAQETLESSQPKPTPLLSVEGASVSAIKVQEGTQSVQARREGDGWRFRPGDGAEQEADKTRLDSLTSRVAKLEARVTVAADPPEAGLSEYGLQAPAFSITVTHGDGEATFEAGAKNPQSTGYYVRRRGEAPVYLVDSFLLDDLKRLLTDLPFPPTPTPTPLATPAPTTTPFSLATPTPAGPTTPTATPFPLGSPTATAFPLNPAPPTPGLRSP